MSDATKELDKRISSAMAALHGARDAMDCCPSGDNILIVEMCQATLDDLLDCRLAMGTAEKVVTV
jgi:hypothetical protein